MKVKSLSRARLLVTPWTAACQASASMGFSRQEYWSRVPLPSPTSWQIDAKTVETVTDFGGSDGEVSVYSAGDLGLIPRSGTSSGEGNGYPLQYSCLENPMDGGAW